MTVSDTGDLSDRSDVKCEREKMKTSQILHKSHWSYRQPIHPVVKTVKNLGSSVTLLIFVCMFSVFLSHGGVAANSLEEVDEKELAKLLNQEQYVAVLFSKFTKLY